MPLSASAARDLVRTFLRNGGDTTAYSNTNIDDAIAVIGNRFVRKTRCTRTKSSLTLTIGSNALPAFPSGFRPEYALRARLSGNDVSRELDIIGYGALLDKRDENDRSAAPEFMAFDTYSTGEVYPEPDFAHTISMWWWEPFNASSFNIPDSWLYEVLSYGAVAILRQVEPENQAWGIDLWKKYLEVELSAMGSGGLGIQSYEAEADLDGAIEAVGD